MEYKIGTDETIPIYINIVENGKYKYLSLLCYII